MNPKKKQDIERYIKHYEKQIPITNDPNELLFLEKEIIKLKKRLLKLKGKEVESGES